ncbi:MAG: hypothetical protein KC466_10600, partial [Myxococcales bacterium]|nr:hypothetical protein [Myxococcales bacterium]
MQFIRQYFWPLNLLLVAVVAYLGARVTNQVVAARLIPAESGRPLPGAVSAASSSRAPGARPLRYYAEIAKRNIFNSAARPEDAAALTAAALAAAGGREKSANDPGEIGELPQTKLNLILRGTAVSSDPALSFAIIENPRASASNKQGLYRMRYPIDDLDDVIVVKVEKFRVVLDNKGEREELNLNEKDEKVAAVGRGGGQGRLAAFLPPSSGGGEGVRQTGERSYDIEEGEIDKALSNMSSLLTQARVVPNFENGQTNGFKIFAIRPDSIFEKLGIKNGDVIQSINNMDINSPDKAFMLLTQLRNERQITMDVRRGTGVETYTYDIRQRARPRRRARALGRRGRSRTVADAEEREGRAPVNRSGPSPWTVSAAFARAGRVRPLAMWTLVVYSPGPTDAGTSRDAPAFRKQEGPKALRTFDCAGERTAAQADNTAAERNFPMRRTAPPAAWALVGLIATALASTQATEAWAQRAEPERFEFVFQDAALDEVVKLIAAKTGKTFIYDDKIPREKVSIAVPEGDTKMTVDEAYAVFQSILKVKGYTTVPMTDYLVKIVPITDAQGDSIRTVPENRRGEATDEYVTRLIRPKYTEAGELEAVIKPLLGKRGSAIAVYEATNTLIITDAAANIDRIYKIIQSLDVRGYETQLIVVPIEFASASVLAGELLEALQEGGGGRATARTSASFNRRRAATAAAAAGQTTVAGESSPIKIIADERTNSLIVVATS